MKRIIILGILLLLIILNLPTTALENYSREYLSNKTEVELIQLYKNQEVQLNRSKNFEKDFVIYYANLLNFPLIDGDIPCEIDSSFEDIKLYLSNNVIVDPIVKVDGGHAMWSSLINYQYLYDKYNHKLDKAWKEYFKLFIDEYNIINKNKEVPTGYHYEGITYDISLVPEFIIKRRKFMNTYPKFPFNYINEIYIDIFLSDFVNDRWQIWNDEEPAKLSNKTKELYEKFLKEADKNTHEYQIINEWYQLLKHNNFSYTKQVSEKVNDKGVWFLIQE